MIEEIARPFHWLALSGVVVMLLSIPCHLIMERGINDNNNRRYIIGLTCTFLLLFTGAMMMAIDMLQSDYSERVRQQVDSLGCEDLQEAYDIYKYAYIKERFLFECVDTREAWWK